MIEILAKALELFLIDFLSCISKASMSLNCKKLSLEFMYFYIIINAYFRQKSILEIEEYDFIIKLIEPKLIQNK